MSRLDLSQKTNGLDKMIKTGETLKEKWRDTKGGKYKERHRESQGERYKLESHSE